MIVSAKMQPNGLKCCGTLSLFMANLYDSKRQRKYLNKKERQLFYKHVITLENPYKILLLLTLLYTGARISEVLDLRVGDVDFNDHCLVFKTLKQRRDYVPRAIPVRPDLLHELKQIIQENNLHSENYLWEICRSTGWRWVKESMAQINLSGVRASPRGLRHGFGVACAMQGIPLTTIQTWMGHKKLETVKIYLAVTGDEARTLIKKTWPT